MTCPKLHTVSYDVMEHLNGHITQYIGQKLTTCSMKSSKTNSGKVKFHKITNNQHKLKLMVYKKSNQRKTDSLLSKSFPKPLNDYHDIK